MKKVYLINIAFSLLIIMVVAKLGADLISYRLSLAFPKTSIRDAAGQSPQTVGDLVSFSPILEKGLFGKATQGKLQAITPTDGGNRRSAPDQEGLLLLGTAQGSFRETFALIQKPGTKEERVFRLGEEVFDMGKLVLVKKEMVEMLREGRRIRLFSPKGPIEEKERPGHPGTSPGTIASLVGSGSYVVDQRALNSALDNIGQTMTAARLLPSLKDGKVEGFKVSEIRPGGIFAMIGMKAGDVLLRINDFSIDSPEKALQSFASLKGQNRVKLDLVRDNQPATFIYDIR
ncbi:MAG: general secretion pathway protein GspC [Desulfobacca sp.]|nr:general secretion pathway protein GspC [Desulfobacca sp.]